jgi:UDP-glucose 4-epimerase
MVALFEAPEAFGRVFNLGGTEEVSMRELADRVINLAGSNSQLEFIPYDIAYEEGFEDMARRVPNTKRAHDLVGFQPQAGLDDIISTVIEDQRSLMGA